MLEGLAVWALFIYLLRLVGMPWNKFTQAFAYIGGGSWLVFVWFGLITYAPMDLSGGSLVQSPHVQLRPASTSINGRVKAIYVEPNSQVTQGQLVYELEPEPYVIALNKAQASLDSAKVARKMADQDIEMAQASKTAAVKDIDITTKQLAAATADHHLKSAMLARYVKQNNVVKHTITASMLDEQRTAVAVAQSQQVMLDSQIEKAHIAVKKAQLSIEKAELTVSSRDVDVVTAQENVAKAQWDLDNTKVYAPADGFVTNFIMRAGQFVGSIPRIQMYTNEKYVLMRVNHQAIRNVKPGQMAEFASAVYPGKVFAAEVEGIVEATGESQGNLIGRETNVRQTTGANIANKHHFVRLKLYETEGYDIPVGSVGLAWVSAEKPISFLGFLDVIRGIIIRMKAQVFYVWSM
ncbi:HlyD family secretion protein [Photobacterium phosphoreum]|uniref:HlyD family secretion protein n=1 Tax=Photobacterium phosphoreum TaxID=659 RepID=UPI0007F8656D|nr:biotin/lipoyl-binding protein [Photobacterium phosphoreum]MCD9469059.1 HlyD family secretion protein [Photobacterium phosphoreum]OBU33564.1 multidrug transporter [Photobacterium phosphoreum]OBU39382.1 multidrug transporter [Photobacterium phosphoreum]PSU77944.1 HlyD family secretion protein [Photobacterium phosphoreum]PSU84509.1 HlyD family secretion protein [Photobacterium phosphoreum]